MATEVRRSRWQNLSMVPDSGSLVYWISKIKAPLSHHNGWADRFNHSDPSRHGELRHAFRKFRFVIQNVCLKVLYVQDDNSVICCICWSHVD